MFLGGVVVALASACGSSPEVPTPVDTTAAAPVAAPTAQAQVDPTTPAPAPSATGPACEELGTLVGTSLVANVVDPTLRSVTVPLANQTSPSRVGVVGVGLASDLVGKTVALGAGVNNNYATCDHCLVVAIGCGTDCSSAAWFYPRSGTGTFTNVASNPGEKFAGTFSDVVLEAVTVDANTSASTPIPGGTCVHITKMTFDATAGAATSSGSDAGTTTAADSGTAATDSGTTAIDSGTDGGTGSSGGHGGGGGGATATVTTTKKL